MAVHKCPRCGLACNCGKGEDYLDLHPKAERTEVPKDHCQCPHIPWGEREPLEVQE